MKTQLVLTMIGPDRPGLVELVSKTLVNFGANWEDSQMARLAGKFAGILRASVAQEKAEALQVALRKLNADGLTIVIESTADLDTTETGPTLKLTLTGSDHEGIVREVTRILATHDVNVEELATKRQSAPMSGEFIFMATAVLKPPATLSTDSLRSALEQIADDLAVEINIA